MADTIPHGTGQRFETLISIMSRLRAPDGCPWDREQTHQTLARCLIDIEAATRTRDGLLVRLSEVGADHEALARVGEELAAAEHAVADAEERWLTLGAEAEGSGLVL